MQRRQAYKIEGIDLESNVVVVEISREILAPLAKAMKNAQPSGHNQIHHAIYNLGDELRNAARVLYGEYDAEDFGYDLLDPVEDEVEQIRETG